jgi:hypothetical protein
LGANYLFESARTALAVVLVPSAGCTSGARAVTLGIAIPALVYALMRVGAARYIDCHAKA